MKFLICTFALVAAASAAVVPGQYVQAGQVQPVTREGLAAIVRSASDQTPEGAYSWSYETENGISAGEAGVPKASGPNGEPAPSVEGGYQYTAPDGTLIQVKYKADDQLGFVAEGAHLPVAPPIPEEILKSLAWNQAHPEEEQWDPAYNKAVQQNVYTGRK